MWPGRAIRTETYRTKIRTAVRVKYSLISYTRRSRIMVKAIIPATIVTCMMEMRTIMRSAISPIMIRYTEIEQTAVRVIDIYPEVPFSTSHIDRTIEIFGSQKPAVLCLTHYPAEVVITNIQCFIIIVERPFVSTHDIIHYITNGIDEIVIYLVCIIILLSTQTQFVCHLIGKETCLLTYLTGTHSSHRSRTGSYK